MQEIPESERLQIGCTSMVSVVSTAGERKHH